MKKLFLLVVSLFFIWFSFASNWDLPWIKIISRQQWWADSKYLFSDYKAYQQIILNQKKYMDWLKKNEQAYHKWLEKKAKEKMQEQYMLTHWKDEIKADKVVKTLDWKKLWWPISYKYNKTKIIIHHTAANYKRFKNVSDVKKYIRWVYYYHAIKRGWGDIGYNFLIWPFGNIYEWRAGGESVVGANSEWNNVPSIGIALIWNFEKQKPTKAQLNALIRLSTALAKKYHINPLKKVTYHQLGWKPPYIQDVTAYALAWHKDTGHTKCPWKYLYNLLPYIRQQVAKNLKKFNYQKSVKTKLVSKKTTQNLTLKLKFSLDWNLKFKLTQQPLIACKSLTSWISVECVDNQVFIKDVKPTPTVFRNVKFTAETPNTKYNVNFKWVFMPDIRLLIAQQVENNYSVNTHKIHKIQHKIYLSSFKNINNLPVNVLLYELTNKFNHYDFKCSKACILRTDKWTYTAKTFSVDKVDPLIVWIDKKAVSTKFLTIDSVGGFIKFTNYNRKSFAWIPWNFFRWKILIKKDYVKQIWKPVKHTYAVINSLPLKDYLKWIAEWNDQMPSEKLKVMALLAKDYVLFYQNKKNIHSSIPKQASYNAIDDPRIFQKYVWAGFEATSRKWKQALQDTENKVITYDGYIPILSYFTCSKGFTFSAKQKFGRIDTPYLQNSPDLAKCNKFYWHWVGLSWKWAEKLAKLGLNYKQIISWYFPGVKVETY